MTRANTVAPMSSVDASMTTSAPAAGLPKK
jgi:hypothetical protein